MRLSSSPVSQPEDGLADALVLGEVGARGTRPRIASRSRTRSGARVVSTYPFRTSQKSRLAAALGKSLQMPEADARTRTGDPFITSEVLYQLSYVGEVAPGRSRGPRPGRDDEG